METRGRRRKWGIDVSNLPWAMSFVLAASTHFWFFLSSQGGFVGQEDITQSYAPRHIFEASADRDNGTVRHILFGLSGNHTGFLAEFEVALKSVILNGPNDPMAVHIMADNDAYEGLKEMFQDRVNLTNSNCLRWPIQIQVYNVEPFKETWVDFIEHRLSVAANMTTDSLYRHTIGSYFRLFAGHILPDDVDNLLYLDSDAVILANLEDIWQRQLRNIGSNQRASNITDDGILFYWGTSQCAGFIVLRPKQHKRLWELYSAVPPSVLREILVSRPVVGDQFVLRSIQRQFPENVGLLGPEWDIHAADGPWKSQRSVLLHHRPQAGMLHFNGGGTSKDAYFQKHRFYKNDPIWGLARYYVDMPWGWVRFLLASRLKRGEKGHPLRIQYNAVEYVEQQAVFG